MCPARAVDRVREISLIDFPLPRCSRRIRPIVSTISIPHRPLRAKAGSRPNRKSGGQFWTPMTPLRGSILHAETQLELPPRPLGEGHVEMTEHKNTLRAVEAPVVVHPAPHRRVGETSQILQALVIPGGRHSPRANGLPDRLGGLGADSRQEADEVAPPPILRPSRLEGASRPTGFRRQPLLDPCMNLSAHTAPIRRTCRSCRYASERTGS